MGGARKPLTLGRLAAWCSGLAALLAAAIVLAASFGAGDVSLWDWIRGQQTGEVAGTILFQVRLPRVLLAALLGGALTVAGVVFQALLRNPLADPYVLGVSGGASIGGVVAVLLGLGGTFGGFAVHGLAFAGAMAALVLIQWVASVDGRLTVYTVLLTGAIFNAFSAALIYFIQSVASLEELHAIVFFLMGRVPSLSPDSLVWLTLAVAAIVLVLAALGRDFNALSLGESGAAQVGVHVERVKRISLIFGSMLTGIAVALAGLIGFVGLVVPHILRMLLGPDHRLLIPAAFFGGAAFLVLADMLARILVSPNELPVGVVTALIGGPFFLYLLRTSRSEHGF